MMAGLFAGIHRRVKSRSDGVWSDLKLPYFIKRRIKSSHNSHKPELYLVQFNVINDTHKNRQPPQKEPSAGRKIYLATDFNVPRFITDFYLFIKKNLWFQRVLFSLMSWQNVCVLLKWKTLKRFYFRQWTKSDTFYFLLQHTFYCCGFLSSRM